MKLESTKNPRVREVAKLRSRRHRDRLERFVIEGRTEVARAIALGVAIDTLYLADGIDFDPVPMKRADHETVRVDLKVFERMAYRENPDGVLAVAPTYATDLERFVELPAGIWLVAVGIEKPGNLGAMLRTADAAGVSGLIVADGVTDLFNPNVVRASLGAVFSVPVAVCSGESARAFLGSRGTQLVATSPEAVNDYDRVSYGADVALVVGPEHAGLDERWLSGTAVRIPMAGIVDSLNASVSAAIVLFEVRRQRRVG